MSEEKQAKQQRKSLLSQRFGERTEETVGRKRGRPPAQGLPEEYVVLPATGSDR